MNRSHFLKTAIIGTASFALAPSLTFAASGKKGLPEHWAWMDGSDETPVDWWKELFGKLAAGNVTGLLINGSDALYAKIGPLGQKAGVQIHAWRWTMNRGDYMQDHPEWYTVNRLGQSVVDFPPYVGYYRWLCPSRPEVTDLLIKDYSRLADIPGISGVHLDYVRYCDIYLPVGLLPKYNLVQDHEMPEFDYCYCKLCRDTFKRKNGYDPMDKEDPSQDKAWHQFRLDQLVNVVQALSKAIHDKGSVITGAVFPTPEMSRTMVRQDWPRFNLDAYMPMLYHDFYLEPTDWIGKCIAEAIQEMGKDAPVYAGVMMNPVTFNKEVLSKTLQQVRKAGGKGTASFTVGGLEKEQFSVLSRK